MSPCQNATKQRVVIARASDRSKTHHGRFVGLLSDSATSVTVRVLCNMRVGPADRSAALGGPNSSQLHGLFLGYRCLRHASANATLDVHEHRWPHREESARATVATVFRIETTLVRTRCGLSRSEPNDSGAYELYRVVQLVLERRRTLGCRDDLLLALVRDPGLDEVSGEDISGGQEVVIRFQRQ
jgi:hypothetical protein